MLERVGQEEGHDEKRRFHQRYIEVSAICLSPDRFGRAGGLVGVAGRRPVRGEGEMMPEGSRLMFLGPWWGPSSGTVGHFSD